MNLDEAIESIWESTRQGIYYPPEWKGKFSVEEGYRVQLGLLARFVKEGDVHVGWKVGPTHKPIQDQLELHEVVFGFLLESAHKPSGSVIAFDDLVAPCFETELCLTLGKRLKGPGVTFEQARAAISEVEPALEIVERRGDFAADISLTIADNVQQKYFVTGAARPPAPDAPLSAVHVEVSVNGEPVDEAAGQAVMGDPAASVAWLANRLADFGRKLEPGTRVMSGSFTRQHPIAQGDLVEALFDPFGPVQVEVA